MPTPREGHVRHLRKQIETPALLATDRLTQRQVERMQMARAHVDQTADIAFGTHHGMDLFSRHQS